MTAYIGILRARPKISSWFGGPLEFASVDLEDASINLTRVDSVEQGVRWNFASLLRRKSTSRKSAGPDPMAAFPSVHMIEGRVNFKFGDTKSIFYLLGTDVDLWPPSRANGPWTLSMRAEPARPTGPLVASAGLWRVANGARPMAPSRSM